MTGNDDDDVNDGWKGVAVEDCGEHEQGRKMNLLMEVKARMKAAKMMKMMMMRTMKMAMMMTMKMGKMVMTMKMGMIMIVMMMTMRAKVFGQKAILNEPAMMNMKTMMNMMKNMPPQQ